MAQLIKIMPFCNLQTETLMQNRMHTFSPCMPKIMYATICGCGALRKNAIFGKWAEFAPLSRRIVTFVDNQYDGAALICP